MDAELVLHLRWGFAEVARVGAESDLRLCAFTGGRTKGPRAGGNDEDQDDVSWFDQDDSKCSRSYGFDEGISVSVKSAGTVARTG